MPTRRRRRGIMMVASCRYIPFCESDDLGVLNDRRPKNPSTTMEKNARLGSSRANFLIQPTDLE